MPKDTFTDSKKTDQNFRFFLKPRQIGGVEQVSSTRAETAFLSSIDVAVKPAVEL